VTRGGEFSFGSVLCAFMFERVVLLCPQAILDPVGDAGSMRLMRWEELLPRQGGGVMGHYFTPTFEWVWWQTPQVFL
jgi:hypothetical protein